MFEQVVGSGANLFLTIVACLIGFAAALGYQDHRKTKKENKHWFVIGGLRWELNRNGFSPVAIGVRSARPALP